jgi:hypothetical protein
MTPRQMLTAAQASQVLGVTARDLPDLIAAGWLRPHGRDARCYPVAQIEAVLNNPGRVPRDLQPGFLRALSHALIARATPGLGCQLRYNGQHPGRT